MPAVSTAFRQTLSQGYRGFAGRAGGVPALVALASPAVAHISCPAAHHLVEGIVSAVHELLVVLEDRHQNLAASMGFGAGLAAAAALLIAVAAGHAFALGVAPCVGSMRMFRR